MTTEAALKAFVDRVVRLEDDKKAVGDDIKLVYAEAKGQGFDSKAIREMVKLVRKDAQKRQEEEALRETYKTALGL